VWQFPTSGRENISRIATFGSTQRVSSTLDSTELSLGRSRKCSIVRSNRQSPLWNIGLSELSAIEAFAESATKMAAPIAARNRSADPLAQLVN
jgi:hypothetical protein